MTTDGDAHCYYDLASITKVMVTATLIQEDFLESGLAFEAYFSQAFLSLSIRSLLEHRSGLPSHVFVWGEGVRRSSQVAVDRERAWETIVATIIKQPLTLPPTEVYSDLGFLLLGRWLEQKKQRNLDDLWQEWKLAHGLSSLDLVYGHRIPRDVSVVPTESRHPDCEVNDDNAWNLGGIAPHAGIFGSLNGVCLWMKAIADWVAYDPRLSPWLLPVPGQRFHLGWDTPSVDNPKSQGGHPAPTRAIGHLGFTGTALWWDPESLKAGVLLTNRVFPQHSKESQERIQVLRNEFFTRVWQSNS